MVDIPVVVTVQWTPELPSELEQQKALASAVLDETRAALVFWCDSQPAERVYFLFRSPEGLQLLERELRGSGEQGGRVDAIALIARTTVETLLGRGTLRRRPAEPAPAAPTPREAPAPEEEEPPSPLSLRLSMSLAYSARMAAATPLFSHCARFSLGLHTGPVLRFLLGTELGSPLNSRESQVTLEQTRFPVILGISALTAIRQWRIGGGINAFFAAIRNTPRTTDETVIVDSPFTRFELSAELYVQGEVTIRENLLIFLGIGIEVFPEDVEYRVTGGPVLFDEIITVQPKAFAGLALFLW